jgi:hypothetical protein
VWCTGFASWPLRPLPLRPPSLCRTEPTTPTLTLPTSCCSTCSACQHAEPQPCTQGLHLDHAVDHVLWLLNKCDYSGCTRVSPAATACRELLTPATPAPLHTPSSRGALSTTAPRPAGILSRHLKCLHVDRIAAACQSAARVPAQPAWHNTACDLSHALCPANTKCAVSKPAGSQHARIVMLCKMQSDLHLS